MLDVGLLQSGRSVDIFYTIWFEELSREILLRFIAGRWTTNFI